MRRRDRRTEPSLVLTGMRHGNRVEVRWDGTPIALRCSSLQLLIDLILALDKSETGYCVAEAIVVHRLRQDLAGVPLIETGMKGQYRLTIPRAELAARTALTPCFFELVGLGIVSREQAEELRRLVPMLDTQ